MEKMLPLELQMNTFRGPAPGTCGCGMCMYWNVDHAYITHMQQIPVADLGGGGCMGCYCTPLGLDTESAISLLHWHDAAA